MSEASSHSFNLSVFFASVLWYSYVPSTGRVEEGHKLFLDSSEIGAMGGTKVVWSGEHY